MKFLLDTNVLTEMVKPNGDAAVLAALAQIPSEDIFLSVLIVGEIVKGIYLLAPGPKKQRLTGNTIANYSERGRRRATASERRLPGALRGFPSEASRIISTLHT